MLAKDRIIVAVDVDHPEKAIEIVKTLLPDVGSFKIGLELITAMLASTLVNEEAKAIDNLRLIRTLFVLLGRQFFWDGKFKDIPNTIGAVSKVVGQTIKVGMFNVHASSGIKGMLEAVANKGESKVLAVTVLTSHEENDAFLDYGAPSKAKVLQYARNAKLAGCYGLVCSPQELLLLDDQPELAGIRKFTPGIRSPNDPADDQKRTMSPREAIGAGANGLVIGRPITGAQSLKIAAEDIAWQIYLGMIDRLHMSLFKQKKIKFGQFKLKLHETQPDAPLSPIYLNIRQLPEETYELAGDILHQMATTRGIDDFDYVIGIPNAGEPIGRAFAKAIGKPLLHVKKIEDSGGRHISSQILDPFVSSKRVVLIDDLITKAGTKREAIASVEKNGLTVAATLVLYDREQGGLKELRAEGCKIYAAAQLTDMLDYFVAKKSISESKKMEVMDYIKAN